MKFKSTKCYSVKVKQIQLISPKAYRITFYNNIKMVIPTSQVFAIDASDKTKQSFWISAWIIDKLNIPHAESREIWFNEERTKREQR